MKIVLSVLMSATLLSTMSCGNKDSKKEKKSPAPLTQSKLLMEEGTYQAVLSPLNSHLAGEVSGTALVNVNADTLNVEINVNGSPSQIEHAQNIHIADTCPTLASDANNDGIIDGVEGQLSYGPVLIPLDNVLKTQTESDAKFPIADFSGNYFYRQDVSMSELMTDLMSNKLQSNLGLAGRQIVIYGVPDKTELPESVAAHNGQNKYSALPIACGSLVKVTVVEEVTNTSGGKDP